MVSPATIMGPPFRVFCHEPITLASDKQGLRMAGGKVRPVVFQPGILGDGNPEGGDIE